MKTAIARMLMFDLECPHCNGLIEQPFGLGSLSFSIHESVPETVQCQDCDAVVKTPARVPGERITKFGPYPKRGVR